MEGVFPQEKWAPCRGARCSWAGEAAAAAGLAAAVGLAAAAQLSCFPPKLDASALAAATPLREETASGLLGFGALACLSAGLCSHVGGFKETASLVFSAVLAEQLSVLDALGPESSPMSSVPSRGLSEETWRPSSLYSDAVLRSGDSAEEEMSCSFSTALSPRPEKSFGGGPSGPEWTPPSPAFTCSWHRAASSWRLLDRVEPKCRVSWTPGDRRHMQSSRSSNDRRFLVNSTLGALKSSRSGFALSFLYSASFRVEKPSSLSSPPEGDAESASRRASCFCSDSLLSDQSCLLATIMDFSFSLSSSSPLRPAGLFRQPCSTGRTRLNAGDSHAASSTLCRAALCFLAHRCFLSPAYEGDSFSSDWTRFRSGERGGSALLGRTMWRTMVGGEWMWAGKAGLVLEMATGCPPRSGEGERWGDVGWGVGEGVRASGERGMLPADLRRPCRRRWPGSLGPRPWRNS
ncbi:hypothetical protein EYF80_028533 [Liparis tanakae]|uniref:Uncharacterized protein n=1 Tax=Liparis tanakae TaxID=230148 RepID=A0A4Z2H5T1_9TELE|nr:hypothetical protein EYF80_028533 [Liparis tanakae]